MKKIFLITFILIFLGTSAFAAGETSLVKAQIISLKETVSGQMKEQLVKVRVLEGIYINEEIDIKYIPVEYSESNFELRKGMNVFISVNTNDDKLQANIMNISREDHLKTLAIIFIIAVTIFGRFTGIFSVTALGISGFIILKFMIPMILKGENPVIVSVACSILIILISFIFVSGFSKKSFASILGTAGGTIIAGILALIFTDLCVITGLADEDTTLLVTQMGITMDYRGLYFSGVLIGTIGVVMDVGMSITSFIFELKNTSPCIGFFKLMRSGLIVGKDIIATMVNTLVLAYAGSSIPLLLLFYKSTTPVNQIISMEIVSAEIIRSLCGSIGLILTIPLTSFIASVMAEKE
ncbi:YibE/F-like protein [Oxobacter pfennigii]|uniref:YibE/F-like protein n=1 Tax=Oxobacter pfennigii TaxID=36849 RepID=A0A0P8YA92_9CLOT|nr:YibE/F family protein [Oxobacter pfennigii]KPU43865.1 YibE/F-like protein [Oxobacter pfennigii]